MRGEKKRSIQYTVQPQSKNPSPFLKTGSQSLYTGISSYAIGKSKYSVFSIDSVFTLLNSFYLQNIHIQDSEDKYIPHGSMVQL